MRAARSSPITSAHEIFRGAAFPFCYHARLGRAGAGAETRHALAFFPTEAYACADRSSRDRKTETDSLASPETRAYTDGRTAELR